MKDVFISYKAEEFDEASWVKSTLETNGISCWMAPACIPGGSSYAVEIPQAIRGAKVFVLILSSKAQTSRWVSKEVDLAINEGKVVLPFMLENCALKDDFNFYLTNVQRYAAYENKLAAAEKMLTEIKAVLGMTDIGQNDIPSYVPAPQSGSFAPAPVASESRTNTKTDIVSILSMVFGIVAFAALFGVLILPDIIALVLSVIGAKNTKAKGGFGFSVTGLVLGALSLIVGLSILFVFAGAVIGVAVSAIFAVIFIKNHTSRPSK